MLFNCFILLAVLYDGAGSTRAVDPESSFSLQRGWFAPGNGFQYKMTSSSFDYKSAKRECQGWGGSLAQHGIRDRYISPKLTEEFAMAVWIGLDDRAEEGTFQWADKRPLNYLRSLFWPLHRSYETNQGNSNADCVLLDTPDCTSCDRELDAVNCNEKHFGLCERTLGNPPHYKSVTIEGNIYALITTETKYALAQNHCQTWGGKLAETPVTNPTVARLIASILYDDHALQSRNSWVGMNDVKTEGVLNLETENALDTSEINWFVNRNTEDRNCGSLNPCESGKIVLEHCSLANTILCEKREPPSGQQIPQSCLPAVDDCRLNDYRSIDGNCHNLLDVNRGRGKRPFKRMLPPAYEDGVGSPRGGFPSRLRSPREIIRSLNTSGEPPSLFASHQMPLWGQLLAHDLTKLGELKDKDGALLLHCPCGDENPECFNIPIPRGDPVRTQKECYPFVRAERVPDINCDERVRAQENRVTSYIDAGNIYGSNELFFSSIRKDDGLLLVNGGPDIKYSGQLPLGTQVPRKLHTQFECEPIHFDFTQLPCMAAGDIRVNEQAALSAGHTTWLRKHNQIATSLKRLNPHWNSEKIFQVSRSIVAAIHQQITYNEFFPILLGETNMKRFGLSLTQKGYYYGYDANYDSTIDISFATAAFRLGHTLINGLLSRPHPDYSENPHAAPIDLTSQFFDPTPLLDRSGVGSVLRGMVSDHAMHYDTQFADALTNHLFAKAGEFGKDLPAINVQRGRDHGIPSYMEHRRFCGLSTTTNCMLLEDIPIAVRSVLCDLYNSTEDIDLFVGGISEMPRDSRQGVPGPTFACIIAYQARDLRKGDAFWFENGGAEAKFTYSQLEAIKKVTLARMICDVGENITIIQPRAMLQHTLEGNSRVSCESLEELDLRPFQDFGEGFVDTEPNMRNDNGDYEWTVWFPYSISSRRNIPLNPAAVLLRHLQVYRADDVCSDVIGTETRTVNGFYQVRYKCHPGTIKATDFPPVDSEEVYFTTWSNQAAPSGPNYIDNETIEGSATCLYPIAIQAQTVTGIPARETGDVFESLSPTQGLFCKGIHQLSGRCHDYRVRFLCLKD